MSNIQKKIEDYLSENDDTEYYSVDDAILMDKIVDFIIDLNADNLSEDQVDELIDIIDELADTNLLDDFDSIDEGISAKRVKIKPTEKRARRREYRKNRAALKLKAKKFRRTAKYKQWARKKEMKVSQGKTATGKRIRKFL